MNEATYEESIRARLCRHEGEDEYDRIDDLLALERFVTRMPPSYWDGAASVMQQHAENVGERFANPNIRLLKEYQQMRQACRAVATWGYQQADRRIQGREESDDE